MKHKRITQGWFYWLLIGLAIITLSCTKEEIGEVKYTFDHYQLIADHYTLDTVLVKRYVLWEDDSIWKQETRTLLDGQPDTWWLMCATEKFPLRIEHWYYLKNGKKIQPSIYPKSK